MPAIARTLMGNPDLLLLDEPSEGRFRAALADRVYVLEKGAVHFSGAVVALRDDKAQLDRLLAL